MPVKIITTVAPDPERSAERASIVDEFFELDQWLKSPGVSGRIKRHEDLRKALVEDANTSWGDRSVARVLPGTVANVSVGAASCKREVVDPRRVQEIVGDEAFYEGITVPLGFVDALLTPEELKECVSEEYTGSRKVTVTARQP